MKTKTEIQRVMMALLYTSVNIPPETTIAGQNAANHIAKVADVLAWVLGIPNNFEMLAGSVDRLPHIASATDEQIDELVRRMGEAISSDVDKVNEEMLEKKQKIKDMVDGGEAKDVMDAHSKLSGVLN